METSLRNFKFYAKTLMKLNDLTGICFLWQCTRGEENGVRTTAFCTRDETCGHGDDPAFDTASLGAIQIRLLISLFEDPPDPDSVVTPAFDTASLGAI